MGGFLRPPGNVPGNGFLPYHIDTQRHYLCQISHFGFPHQKHHRHCTMVPLQHRYLPLLPRHFPSYHTRNEMNQI